MADIDAYKKQLLDVDSSVTNQYTMVKRVAYHLRSRLPSNISTDDLVQAGMEGLLQAKAAFDQSRGINFELLAKTRIRGAMLDEVRRISFSTRSIVSTKREHEKVISELTQTLGRAPKGQEIADKLGKSPEEYERERLFAEGADVVSSDAAPEYYEEIDESLRSPEQALEHSELIESLAGSIEQLPERTQQILALYYQEEMNLKEIGAILDVSESRVSQILSETAGKLRVLMNR